MGRRKSSVEPCAYHGCKKIHVHIPTTAGEVILVGGKSGAIPYLFAGPRGADGVAFVEGRDDLIKLRDALTLALRRTSATGDGK